MTMGITEQYLSVQSVNKTLSTSKATCVTVHTSLSKELIPCNDLQ